MNHLICLTDGFTVVLDVSLLQFKAKNKYFELYWKQCGKDSATSLQGKKRTIINPPSNSNGFYAWT